MTGFIMKFLSEGSINLFALSSVFFTLILRDDLILSHVPILYFQRPTSFSRLQFMLLRPLPILLRQHCQLSKRGFSSDPLHYNQRPAQFSTMTSRTICKEVADLSDSQVEAWFNSFDTVMTDCDGVLWIGINYFPQSNTFIFTI